MMVLLAEWGLYDQSMNEPAPSWTSEALHGLGQKHPILFPRAFEFIDGNWYKRPRPENPQAVQAQVIERVMLGSMCFRLNKQLTSFDEAVLLYESMFPNG